MPSRQAREPRCLCGLLSFTHPLLFLSFFLFLSYYSPRPSLNFHLSLLAFCSCLDRSPSLSLSLSARMCVFVCTVCVRVCVYVCTRARRFTLMTSLLVVYTLQKGSETTSIAFIFSPIYRLFIMERGEFDWTFSLTLKLFDERARLSEGR